MNKTTWTADQVWAAAARACRINNGEYLRNDEWLYDPSNDSDARPGRKSSRTVMLEGLKDLEQLTEFDYTNGRDARQFLQKRYMFRALKSDLNGFEHRLIQCLTLENFERQNSTNMNVIVSQIPRWKNSIYEETLLRDTISQPLATVGERITRDIIVVRTIYSEKYQLNFITAKTSCNHVVFFAFKEAMQPGKECQIHGTVKAHKTDSTQLNRVKVFDH